LGNYRQIDDYQFGGGAGMVLMAEPLDQLLTELHDNRTYDDVIYLTPDGEAWNQASANRQSLQKNLILICGHYKGIDQRIRDLWVTKEVSVGDYVLSGGEIAACILADSIIRLIPGVLNNATSALEDSFQNKLLAPPVYTRPSNFKGLEVPKVLLSGNFKEIEKWRDQKSMEITKNRRPDLLEEE
jgi:tRNA (guanine37-N1)-methyltransferase